MSDSNKEEQFYSYAQNKNLRMSELVGKTASGEFDSHDQQVNELKAKIASLEKEKEEAYKQGEQDHIAKSKREMIESLVPRNLPQYRSDDDFNKEVQHRLGDEYTSIEDLACLYDAKLKKYALQLSGKTASRERNQFYQYLWSPLEDYGIVGNSMIHRNSNNNSNNTRTRITTHTYEPIASKSNNVKGRTASAGLNDSNFWFLDLFSNIGS